MKSDDAPVMTMKLRKTSAAAALKVGGATQTLTPGNLVGRNPPNNTIDGGIDATPEARSQSLMNCSTAGGQMGVIVNTTDSLYEDAEFVEGGYINQGIDAFDDCAANTLSSRRARATRLKRYTLCRLLRSNASVSENGIVRKE